jgi:hypothetical protein
MRLKHALFSTLLILSFISSVLSQPGQSSNRYTLQIAAFPESEFSQKFVDELKDAGENPAWGTVELPNRGKWIRIFVGSFKTVAQARRHGERLVARGIIKEFLVRPLSQIKTLSRPRSVADSEMLYDYVARPIIAARSPAHKSFWIASPGRANRPTKPVIVERTMRAAKKEVAASTKPEPTSASLDLALMPPVDESIIPRLNPVLMALNMIAGGRRPRPGALQRGGLWVTGDREEALARLRWIVGDENAEAISLDEEGKVRLNDYLLAVSAGVAGESEPAHALKALDYITSNDGLLLLIQLIQGAYRYCLHIGSHAPTLGGDVPVSGSVNMDNNFDSRINPYRRLRKKLDQERPPKGFDCLIGINPSARWFNLRAGQFVPAGHITFHELTEAHAKIELGLDYLGQGALPGAHNVALEREKRLQSQRPFGDVVITVGSNRVLRTEKEYRQFYVEASNKGREQK